MYLDHENREHDELIFFVTNQYYVIIRSPNEILQSTTNYI